MTGNRRHFPSLKDTLAVRMGDPTPSPDPSEKEITPPNLPVEAASLPTVIETTHLKAKEPSPADPLKAEQYKHRGRRSTTNFLVALGATFLAGALSGYALYVTNLIPGIAKAAVSDPPAGLVWPKLLSPGLISPRGQSSAGITADQAFQIADSKLHDTSAPDYDEARYWLRVGIAGALTSDRLRWALTQLGTLYARPDASRSDLATARSAWELATAQKDPVALCFLARLEAGQSGTQPNRALALELFKQAKATGLCNGADQAIERLSE